MELFINGVTTFMLMSSGGFSIYVIRQIFKGDPKPFPNVKGIYPWPLETSRHVCKAIREHNYDDETIFELIDISIRARSMPLTRMASPIDHQQCEKTKVS